jgi:hypothetical protein
MRCLAFFPSQSAHNSGTITQIRPSTSLSIHSAPIIRMLESANSGTNSVADYTINIACSSLICSVTQPRLVVGYRRFRTTCQSHLQGSNSLELFSLMFVPFNISRNYFTKSWTALPLKIRLIGFPEISITNHQPKLITPQNSEDLLRKPEIKHEPQERNCIPKTRAVWDRWRLQLCRWILNHAIHIQPRKARLSVYAPWSRIGRVIV